MGHNTDIATRACVVSLKAPCNGKSTAEVAAITGLAHNTINYIYARAVARGFNPNKPPLIIRNCYLEYAPRSGRPTKRTKKRKEKNNHEGMLRPIRKGKKLCLYCQRAQIRRNTTLSCFSLEGFQGCWLPQDQGDDEACIDEEDEAGTP